MLSAQNVLNGSMLYQRKTSSELLLSGEKEISNVLRVKGMHTKVENVLTKQMLSTGICKLTCIYLFPAIGAVNAMRSNYNFQMLPHVQSEFGSCPMKIDNKKAKPPVEARRGIARTYLYMDDTYSRYSMSKSQKQLMNAWDKMYPVSEWECTGSKKIASIQKNRNEIVENRCNER